MASTLVLHLVSHASGELIEMLARNAVAHLHGVQAERRLWKMVRRLGQVPEILAAVAESPGYVLHSVSHSDIRAALEQGCQRLKVPCDFALEPLLGRLAEHCGAPLQFHASAASTIDEDYYTRIEAMKYTLAHDDGVAPNDLEGADVILVGVSRSTKTPTCMYLASRGIKAANVPLVPGAAPPPALLQASAPLVVGLTVDPARLVLVRQARLKALHQEGDADYADLDRLRQEVLDARRLFTLHGWPEINVTQRSIEQTAALIIDMLARRADRGHRNEA
jgi:[pyruvate, water dikinase]-phosphate phosphotransferase / [pyruvate, water dikinase] kinase